MGNEALQNLQALDKQFHLHPFTHHGDLHAQGTHIITHAEGCHVTDATGRRLLDGLAGLWCVNVGYGCSEIVEAVHSQMAKLPYYCSFFNTTHEPAIRLAETLGKTAPGRLRRTLFCNSGSEANETALKVIRGWNKLRGHTRKTKILSRTYSYHGVTLGSASITGLTTVSAPFDLPLPGFLHVPGPHPYGYQSRLTAEEFGIDCLRQTAELIEREGADSIAAMFVEPVQGAGGVIVPPRSYLRELRQMCRENDILFVADEVITGFGRLGSRFASELWDLDPDLMTLAKGITSGYLPLGATMVSEEIAEDLVRGGSFSHGFTYSGHPTCAAAALANLEVIEKRQLIPRVRDDIGPYFQEQLRSFSHHPYVAEVRGHGLIGALELVPEGGRAALKPDSNLGAKAAKIAREEGVIIRGIRDLIAVSPPFIITRAEVDALFGGIRRTLDRM
jgi:putrescine---pyruvate transaminase